MKITWFDRGGVYQLKLEPDSTVTETHLLSSTVTQHPVEKGVAITDHVQPQPFKLSCECVISNTPIFMPNDDFTYGATMDTGAALAVKDLQGNVLAKAATQQITAVGGYDRVSLAHSALADVQTAGTLITIETALATYDHLVIVGLSVPRSTQYGSTKGVHHAMKFTMDCQQVRTVQTQEVEPPAPLHVKKQNGVKPVKQVDEKAPDNRTLARKLAQSLVGPH